MSFARATAVASVIALGASVGVPAAAAASPRHSDAVVTGSATSVAVAADADWLLQGQLPDGAIAWYVDRGHISPYLANYAAIGLAEAGKVTGQRAYSDAAWSWLDWYAAHQDANGVVTDYDVVNGVEISTGDEDSTDAYAGTFLSAVRATYIAESSRHKLRSLHSAVTAAVAAIEATQDADGLTWAKPAWHVKYLMDQAETYNGLLSAVDVASFLGDGALEQRAYVDAAKMKAGISSLWDPATNAYDWAKGDGGWVTTTNWNVLYSDAMEQAWIAGTSAVSSAQANALLDSLGEYEPQWASPTATADMNGVTGTVGYWPVAGWALLKNGRAGDAQAAATSIRTAALGAARGWPFTTGDAGQLIVLESGDASLVTPFAALTFF